MRVYTNDDVSAKALAGMKVAVVGYGSQGRAHALNLRDSGNEVVVGVRKGGKGWDKAQADGLKTAEPRDAVDGAGITAILTPDMTHDAIWRDAVEPAVSDNAAVLFAHGFSVHYRRVHPKKNIDVVLVAPKGPGDLVRREFARGRGVPCLFAVHQDASGRARERAMGYARGIGGTSGGCIETTFAEETETDLFGEQSVLCGGVTELVLAGYETLVEGGYKPEVAYFECLHELKLIVDLLHEGGLRQDAPVRVGDRQIRRSRLRSARRQRRDQAAHEGDPGRHPVRRLCARVDPGEPGRAPALRGAAQERPRPSDRTGRP